MELQIDHADAIALEIALLRYMRELEIDEAEQDIAHVNELIKKVIEIRAKTQ